MGGADLYRAYQAAYKQVLPRVTQVADSFHVVGAANAAWWKPAAAFRKKPTDAADGNKTPSTRYATSSPSPARNTTTTAKDACGASSTRATPAGEVRLAWHAKETVRRIYQTPDPADADEFTRLLAQDLQHESCPPEVNQLGKTLHTWRPQIVAWHRARVTNASTEAVNNLVKRVKRVAFGFRNFRNYRTRALLYAGKPNWNLLPTLTPP